jgi:hypothetical protein
MKYIRGHVWHKSTFIDMTNTIVRDILLYEKNAKISYKLLLQWIICHTYFEIEYIFLFLITEYILLNIEF